MKLKKIKRIICALLTASVMFAFTACSGESLKPENSLSKTAVANDSKTSESKAEESSKTNTKNTRIDNFNSFTAEKTATLNDCDVKEIDEGGVIYRDADSDKYGIISLDGSNDTGAKYTKCVPKGKFFLVTDSELKSASSFDDMNVFGLVDGFGNEIVEQKYAVIEVENDYFAVATKITKKTDNEDDALVYQSDDILSLYADEDDTLFAGEWYVYSIEDKKKIPNVKGTKNTFMNGTYKHFEYTDADENNHIINKDGKELPEDTQLFSDGSYIVEENNKGAVYDMNDKILFEYNPLSVTIYNSFDNKYINANVTENDKTQDCILDTSGKRIFKSKDTIEKCGNGIVMCYNDDDYYCCTLTGEKIDVKGTAMDTDNYLHNGVIVTGDSEYSYVLSNGEVIINNAKECDSSNFAFSETSSDGSVKYYSYQDGDFTIEGYAETPYCASVSDGKGGENLLDLTNNNNIITGYSSYECITADDEIYVFARNADIGGDVYRIHA